MCHKLRRQPKVWTRADDNSVMGISSVGSDTATLAATATGLKAGEVMNQIATAVLKQAQDIERQQAQALIQMMQQTTAAARGGVDVYA